MPVARVAERSGAGSNVVRVRAEPGMRCCSSESLVHIREHPGLYGGPR